MNHKEVQEIIEKIENEFDVEKLSYKNINVWPLLKFHLFWRLYKFENTNFSNRKPNLSQYQPATLKLGQKIKYHLKNILTVKYAFIMHVIQSLFFNLKKKTSYFLFVDVPDSFYQDKIDNKKISKYIFSYLNFLKKRKPTAIINLHNSKIKNNERFFSVLFYNSSFLFTYYSICNIYKSKFKKQNHSINQFSEFQKYLLKNSYPSVVSEYFLCIEMDKIIIYKKIWYKILNKIKPKIVFVECYYGSNSNYGLFLATADLNIKTVDVQHGVSLGFFYIGWHKLSKNNSKLLPSYYWCWSNYDAHVVNNSRKNNLNFKAIIGGNLWLNKCIENNTKNDSNLFIDNLIDKEKPKKVILVTLQHSIPISSILIEAIKTSPKEWLWLIRFHPFDSVDPNYRSTYINAITNVKNVEYINATKAYLYPLISQSNVHITHHSNVAIEALTFKVPTILLGNIFEEFYKDYINAGYFYVSLNSLEILTYISNDIKINQEKYDFYKMQCDEEVANKFLEHIIT